MDPVPLAIGTVRLIDKYELFEVDERSITLLIGQRANSSAPAPSPPTASPPPLSLLSTGAGSNVSGTAMAQPPNASLEVLAKDVVAAALAIPPDLISVERSDVGSGSRTDGTQPSDGIGRRRLSNSSLVAGEGAVGGSALSSVIALSVRVAAVPPVEDVSALERSLSSLDLSELKDLLVEDDALGVLVSSVERMPGVASRRINYTALAEVAQECPAGFWCTSGKIIPCGEGFWSNTTGESYRAACKSCPDFSTSRPNSTHPFDCVCLAGYYDARTSFSLQPPRCRICMSGTYCNRRNTTIETLPINVGYYRVSTTSIDLHRCLDSAANCSLLPDGTLGRCLDGASGCIGGTYDPTSSTPYVRTQCADGLRGPLCKLCDQPDDESEPKSFYLAATREKRAHCKVCEASALFTPDMVASVSMVLVGGVLLLLLLRTLRRRMPPSVKEAVARWLVIFGLKPKIKALYGFWTIVSNRATQRARLPVPSLHGAPLRLLRCACCR